MKVQQWPRFLLLCIAMGFLIALGCKDRGSVPPVAPAIDPVQEISVLIKTGRLDEAEKVVLARIAEEPENATYLAIAGEIAFMHQRWSIATERFLAASKSLSGPAVVPILHRAARCATQTGKYFLATEQLARIIREVPNDAVARREIAGVQCAIGFEWESMDHLQWLVRNFNGPPADLTGTLMVLADRSRPQCDPKWIEAGLKFFPEDLRPLVGSARLAAFDSKWPEVRTICEKVLAKHHDFLPAWVLYGRALWETGQREEFQTWIAHPPENAATHPDYWLALGTAAAGEGDSPGAARALWEALRRDPTLREAARALAPILSGMGKPELGISVAEYARMLEDIVSRVDHFAGWQNQSQTGAVEIAERMLKLGRLWEADRWAKLATVVTSDPSPRTVAVFRECTQPLNAMTPLFAVDRHPQRWEKDLAEFPMPSLQFSNAPREAIAGHRQSAESPVRLVDQAEDRGLVFRFENGDDPTQPGIWIHESNGNGIAILDFDHNGLPDVFIPQAGGKPLLDGNSRPSNLYRNRSGRFDDATKHVVPPSNGYGQGAGAGDYNDDGFTDLAVGNIGSNGIYRNNGDGTFSDVTAESRIHGKRWTTSVVLADLDGDDICDFLEVGYCAGSEPFTVACYAKGNHQVMACSPNAFKPEPDRFWKGVGDGTFDDQTARAMSTAFPGRGLGVLVTDFDGKPGLEIFVANDMTANHFWVPNNTDAGVVFEEQAAVRGLATDMRGSPQACMGIAAGDPDHDGDLDLVVTNFALEANNFYQQIGAGRFADRAAASGLAEPSRPMLGYGCQFADFDGDGITELLVANGHVQDEASDAANAMYPQLFSYIDGWRELDRTPLGPYFSLRHMGRGMALLDAQADGWPDVLITHVVKPAALLINQSQHKRTPLVLELVARTTRREAIGARVEMEVEGRKEVRWITAGDGFQSSNERKLWFAVPNEGHVDLTIVWPHGNTQSLAGVAAGSYLVIEGSEPVLRQAISP